MSRRRRTLIVLASIVALVACGIFVIPFALRSRERRMMREVTLRDLWKVAAHRADGECSTFMGGLLVAIRRTELGDIPERPLLLEARIEIPEQHVPPELAKSGWDDNAWRQSLLGSFAESPNGFFQPYGFLQPPPGITVGRVPEAPRFGILVLQWLKPPCQEKGEIPTCRVTLASKGDGRPQVTSCGLSLSAQESGNAYWHAAFLVEFTDGEELAFRADVPASDGKSETCVFVIGRKLLATELYARVGDGGKGPVSEKQTIAITSEGRFISTVVRQRRFSGPPLDKVY